MRQLVSFACAFEKSVSFGRRNNCGESPLSSFVEVSFGVCLSIVKEVYHYQVDSYSRRLW